VTASFGTGRLECAWAPSIPEATEDYAVTQPAMTANFKRCVNSSITLSFITLLRAIAPPAVNYHTVGDTNKASFPVHRKRYLPKYVGDARPNMIIFRLGWSRAPRS
jgi:hypothetical protein